MNPSKKLVGYTTGVYDLFHIGHLNLLSRAKAECDELIVGVTTDELAESRKAKRPVIPYAERVEIVRALRCVDRVVPQSDMNKLKAWETLRFDVVFVGDDWRGTPTWVHYEHEFSRVGVRVVYFPYTTHTSSSKLRGVLEALLAG